MDGQAEFAYVAVCGMVVHLLETRLPIPPLTKLSVAQLS